MVEGAIPTRISTLASILRVDATTIEVTGALRAAGVRPIILKGPSIARWLYESKEDRPYTDVDLLVSPGDLAAAEGGLLELGFTPYGHQSGADRKLRPHHALPWTPPARLGAIVDLHQTIGDVKGEPAQVWAALSKDTEHLDLSGTDVEVLGVAGRCLHVAVHVAHHSGLSPPSVEDLRRAVARVSFETWTQAVDLAREMDALEELANGLGLVPEGAELRRRLGLSADVGADAFLRRPGVPPLARGINWILDEPLWRRRVGLAIAAAFPSAPEMRDWSRLARTGRIGLAAAYLARPFWVIWRLPRGWRAARRARGKGPASLDEEELTAHLGDGLDTGANSGATEGERSSRPS